MINVWFTEEEHEEISKFLSQQYIGYECLPLMSAVRKITSAGESNMRQLMGVDWAITYPLPKDSAERLDVKLDNDGNVLSIKAEKITVGRMTIAQEQEESKDEKESQ